MSTKCSPASGASSALVEQGEAVTPHFLDNTIFSLRMAEVNACITQNDPVLALNHLKNIRMLAQRGSAVESLGGYSHPRDGLWLRWCEAFADAWVVWADNAVTVNARLPTKSVESQSTLRQVYAIEDLVKGLANAGLHLVNCSTNRPHLLTDCSSGSHTDMVPFTFFTKLGRLLSRLSLLVDVPADDGQLSQQASDRLNLLLRELATPLFSSYGYDTSSSTLSACLSSYTLSLTSQATRMAMSLKFETSKMTPSLNQQLSEPMIVLADFCDRKLTEASPSIQQAMEMDSEQLSTGALCYSFIEATLCSMQLNHRAGHLRFPRALQLASTDNDPGSSIQSLFISGTAKLPTWMFTQWLDLLVTGLFATATSEPVLVNQIIDRVAVDYAQIMLPPFLVKTSALLDDYWSNTDELAGGPGFNLQSINDAARPSVQRLFQLLSESQVYARFVEELSFLEEPKLVLKDWLASRAKRTVSNSEPNSGARLVLVQDYTNLLLRSFRRSTTCELSPEGFIVETASGSLTSGPYRTMLSERLMKACNQVFGPGGSQFASASITDIEQSIKQLELLLETQQTPSDVNRLADYSPWLATFSSNDSAGGQFLAVPSAQYSSINHAQLTQRAHIYRFGLSLNTLVSLRQPKLISLVGSNAKHYSWLVKGGEDLRQDTRIQHMFSITNQLFGSNWFGAASFFNPQSENAPVLVRTYSIIPISNRVGLVEWLESATTLLAFYKAAMCDSELQNFNQEISFFGELLAGSDYSGLWCSPLTSYPKSLRPEQIVTRFRELENRIRSWRLLRRGLQRMSRDVTHFMELRSMCIRTQASLSAVHYVLGIGDRHPLNFLLCRKTGAFIGIDFGYAFGVTTLVLPVPELVPFRLTACQRELLEPSGPAGMFGYTLGRTLASARMARPLLTSLLQVFVKDSSCWALYSHLIQQSQIDFTRGRLELALKKLSGHSPATLLCEEVAIRYKSHAWFPEFCRLIDQLVLVGPQNVEANSQLALTPEEQARQLTRLATSADLLARAHIGWHSFL